MRARWLTVASALLLTVGTTLAAEPAPKPAPAPAPTPVRPVVTAEQHARITVGRGVLHVDTTIDYAIRQGKVDALSVAVPADAAVLGIKGEGVQSWGATAAGAARVLKIQLAAPVGGAIQLWLQLDQPVTRAALGQPVPFAVPAIVPGDVSRETGVVALLAEWGMTIEAIGSEGVAKLTPRELPDAFEDVRDQVVLAWRYAQRPFAIEAQATEVQARPVISQIGTGEPPRLLLHQATATGTVGETVAKVSLKLAFEATAPRPPERSILPPTVSLTKVTTGEKTGARVIRDAKGYILTAQNRGDDTIDLDYVTRVEKKDKIRTLVLPLVAAAQSATSLTIPGASVKVALSPEISYETETKGQDTVLTVYGAAAEQVTVTWEPKIEEKDVEPVLFADQNARLTVGRGVLRVDTAIDYTILQGKVAELAVALPADATLLSVKGEGIRTWDVAAQGTDRLLKVQLLDAATGSYQLGLQVEQAIAKGGLGQAAAFTVPTIAAQGVERETGALGILVWKGLKVEPVKTEGVTQVDIREMPEAFQKLKEQVHLAYRYLQRPFTVEAQVSEVEAKVSAEVLTAVRVSPESLRLHTTIAYTIRDAGIFRFQIKLPKDVRLVDIEGKDINNWERSDETLTIDLRSKAEGPYSLTLEAEQPVPPDATPDDANTVEVTSIELLDVARERGHLALTADPGIKVEPVEVKDIMQIDVRDLPKADKKAPPTAELAFRYLRHPYTLRVAVSKIQAEVDATVHTAVKISEKTLETSATLQYEIRKAGIFQLQVALPEGFNLLGCDGVNIDDWKVTDGVLTVSLKQKTEGSYTLTLTGKQDVGDLARLPVPVFVTKGTEKETGFIAVRADESLRLKTAETASLVEIDVKELPAPLQKDTPLLAYRYFDTGWSGAVAAELIEPHVTAETFSFLSLGEAQLQVTATVRYTILYAGVQTFQIALPEGASNVDINGDTIKHREENKEIGTWTITLQAKRKGDYSLYVTFQQKIDSKQVDLKYEGVHADDPAKKEDERLVKRETGYLAVAARSDLELAAGADLEGLTPIDPQEIPAHYKAGITAPILLAFRYLKHPYTLHAVAARHDPADVLVAVIEACLLDTTVTEEGNVITDVACRLRNTREQNLAIALPEGAELWHVFVDGRRAVPVKSTENGVTWTKVPIAGVGSATRAFVVQLRYGYTIDALGGSGVLRLDFPQMAIPAMRLGWIVALPEKYRLVRHGGSLRHVERIDRELASLGGVVPVERAQDVAKAKIQVTDQYRFNQMAMDNVQQEARATGQGGRWSGQRSIYTGTKPETSNLYLFQSLIAMKDAGSIRSTYLRESVDYVLQGVLVLLTLVAVAAFWRLCRGLTRSWRVGVLFAGALVVLGIRTLSEQAWRQQLSDVLWTLVIATVAAVLYDAASRLRRKGEPPSEPDPPSEPPAAPPADEPDAAPPEPEPPAEEPPAEEPSADEEPEADGEKEG